MRRRRQKRSAAEQAYAGQSGVSAEENYLASIRRRRTAIQIGFCPPLNLLHARSLEQVSGCEEPFRTRVIADVIPRLRRLRRRSRICTLFFPSSNGPEQPLGNNREPVSQRPNPLPEFAALNMTEFRARHAIFQEIGGLELCQVPATGSATSEITVTHRPLKVGCELWVVVRTNLGQIWPETLAYVRTKRPKFPGCTGIGARRSCALRRERISISAAIKASRARKQADEADE
ncbi:hypothetical protein GGX14DRAFT_406751 [Mycena pura]|uniref:Uncharacterized protein n=1 Tax=Mycena pura TaxID=153505 RepID=A0AAD6USK3_9AGAR|nr:hypothetical protein GGX14DRAFT_406751 [Mycena pura]